MLLGLEVYLGYLDGLRLVMGIDKAIPGLGREPKTRTKNPGQARHNSE